MLSDDRMMMDGFRTRLTLANIPSVKMYEKEVTPPAISGGDLIDVTTMHNADWETAWLGELKRLGPINMTVAYAPSSLSDIMAQIGINQLITLTLPGGSTFKFWGGLGEFTPSNHARNEQPTATVVINPTNLNASRVETAPLWTAASVSTDE